MTKTSDEKTSKISGGGLTRHKTGAKPTKWGNPTIRVISVPLQPEEEKPTSQKKPKNKAPSKWGNGRPGWKTVSIRANSTKIPNSGNGSNGPFLVTYYIERGTESGTEWVKLESCERPGKFTTRDLSNLQKAVYTYWWDNPDSSQKVQFKLVDVFPGDYAGNILKTMSLKQKMAYMSRRTNCFKQFVANGSSTQVADEPVPANEPVLADGPVPANDPETEKKIREVLDTIVRLTRPSTTH